jgi:ATP-dependent exoDNAse (exonuclease V) alpha subunit
MTQKDALKILKTGKNVFITGPAGSGKTFVVNEYIRYLKDHEVPIGITASTGIAATHMGGVTIHSWTGIGVKDRLNLQDIEEIGAKSYIKNKIQDAKVLIIDEVSMLHHFRFDMINRVLKHVRRSTEPFGGLQVVLCGDFFQLPPVSRMGEQQARFIYDSMSWKEGNFVVCYLHENYRQNDDPILAVLNEIRSGEVGEDSREQLKSRHLKVISQGGDDEVIYKSEDPNSASIDSESTRLYTHNIDVDSINDRELSKVGESEIVYEMTSKGKKPLVEALKKSCLAPEILRLKKGARVMCVKNNFDKGYVNGTLGVVISCAFGANPIIRTVPSPGYPEGRKIEIEKATWVIEEDDKILAELNQYPLRLAWAITVHKSQGMSLDKIEVDLSKAFEPGMGYVALSRVRTLSGLSISGFSENALCINREVLEYDRHLKALSEKAERVIESTDEVDIVQSQSEFLAKVAPLHAIGGGSLKKAKAKKLSTYDKTRILIKKEKSISDIAKERGLEEETVISQIESLVEGGKGVNETLNISDIMYLKREISAPHFVKLGKALEEVSERSKDDKPPLLSPVKSKVGPNVSWKEIRLARVLLGYIKKGGAK